MQVSVGEALQSNIAIPQMQKGDRQTKIARQKKPGGDRNWPPGSLVSCWCPNRDDGHHSL